MPPFFPAHLILAFEEALLQELETESGKDIAVAGKVEDVAAADTLKDVIACSVFVNVEDVAVADSVKDVVLFERMSKEPLPLELAGNVKELVALSESTLLMSLDPSCITCSLLSTRASDVPQSPQSMGEYSPWSNRVREALRLDMFIGLGRLGRRP
jgi:hypothetical protein